MHYNPKTHHRRSIRLQGYDYSRSGAYFVTVCAYNKECLFGEIVDGKMVLNEYGNIILREWMRTPVIRMEMSIDEFVIMPNHIHGIVCITNIGANSRSPLREPRINMGHKTLASFIAGFKSITTKQINQIRNMPGVPVWQRNYYEHVVRDVGANGGSPKLDAIRQYIQSNPGQWNNDENYVANA